MNMFPLGPEHVAYTFVTQISFHDLWAIGKPIYGLPSLIHFCEQIEIILETKTICLYKYRIQIGIQIIQLIVSITESFLYQASRCVAGNRYGERHLCEDWQQVSDKLYRM